jgi:hypothetical protein
MGQDSLRVVSEEIARLRVAQDQAYAEIDAKIELLFAQLQENPK